MKYKLYVLDSNNDIDKFLMIELNLMYVPEYSSHNFPDRHIILTSEQATLVKLKYPNINLYLIEEDKNEV